MYYVIIAQSSLPSWIIST